MKQKSILYGSIVVVAAAVLAFLVFDGESNAPTTNSSTPQSQTPSISNDQAATTAGQYLDYSASALASAKGSKILFFHASWCPQCRALEESIQSGNIPNGVSIFKVDYDSSSDLKKQYGVTLQTTLVKVDDSGNLVKKYVAYDNPTLDSLKSNLLQ